jgi:rubrerythrin
MASKQKLIEFTEDERTTLTNSLRVAAEVFYKDAEVCYNSEGLHSDARTRLRDQFKKQYREARELADKIDNAGRVLIEPVLYECQNCDWVGTEDELKEIPAKHYHERVSEGEPEPDGECPSCGALCHQKEN